MAPLPKKIKVALASALHDWEIASIERWTADEYLAVFEGGIGVLVSGRYLGYCGVRGREQLWFPTVSVAQI